MSICERVLKVTFPLESWNTHIFFSQHLGRPRDLIFRRDDERDHTGTVTPRLCETLDELLDLSSQGKLSAPYSIYAGVMGFGGTSTDIPSRSQCSSQHRLPVAGTWLLRRGLNQPGMFQRSQSLAKEKKKEEEKKGTV